MLIVPIHAHTFGQLPGQAHCQRHFQGTLINAVVVEITIVLVQGLAVVPIDHHQRIIPQAEFVHPRQQALDTRIHVRDFAIVLRHHKVRVRNARRHPTQVKIPKRLERLHRRHRGLGRVARVFAVKHRIERRRRQIGRVRIHVPQKQEKRFVACGQPLQVGQRHLVEQLGLSQGTLVPTAPCLKIDVFVKPARTRIPGEPDAQGLITLVAQNLGQGRNLVGQPAPVAERDHVGRKTIHPGQHGRVRRRRGDVRAKRVFKQDALRGELVDIRRGQAVIAVTTHVIRPQAVDAEQNQILFFHVVLLKNISRGRLRHQRVKSPPRSF